MEANGSEISIAAAHSSSKKRGLAGIFGKRSKASTPWLCSFKNLDSAGGRFFNHACALERRSTPCVDIHMCMYIDAFRYSYIYVHIHMYVDIGSLESASTPDASYCKSAVGWLSPHTLRTK